MSISSVLMQVLGLLDGRDHHYLGMYIVVGDWYREQEPIYETRSGMQDPIRINLFLQKKKTI